MHSPSGKYRGSNSCENYFIFYPKCIDLLLLGELSGIEWLRKMELIHHYINEYFSFYILNKLEKLWKTIYDVKVIVSLTRFFSCGYFSQTRVHCSLINFLFPYFGGSVVSSFRCVDILFERCFVPEPEVDSSDRRFRWHLPTTTAEAVKLGKWKYLFFLL